MTVIEQGMTFKHENGKATVTGTNSRKAQVLALVAEGKTSAEIAEQLGISPNTVKYHRKPKKVGMRQMVREIYKWVKAQDRPRNVSSSPEIE